MPPTPPVSPSPDIHPPTASAGHHVSIGSWVRMVLGIGMAVAGVLLFGRHGVQAPPQSPSQPAKMALPVVAQIGGHFEVTERSGQKVDLSALRGKVTVIAALYTVCPHGSAPIMTQMRRLNAAYRERPDFLQVSLALSPQQDTPAFLNSYAQGVGVRPADPWWFVVGEQQPTWDFMTSGLRLQAPTAVPPEKRMSPLDLYKYDLRLVLVDRQGRVRGHYAVFLPLREEAARMSEQLRRDVQFLLDNPAE
ncbi:SCO family protein [Prosthecobacter sp.]|uniref:SCO family protein n=1 Tax=Prosthecobacter sp. TaxID=1965333 RepID=UPI003784D923